MEMQSKVTTLENALSFINDGCVLMFGGFGGVGNPPTLIKGILQKGTKDLTLIGNDAGFPEIGIGKIVSAERVSKLITTHIGSNPIAGKLMVEGKMEVEFCPQGILAERIRAGGAGLGGVLSDIGMGSMIDAGKQKVEMGGKTYLIESALQADVAIVHAKKADYFGNLIYDKSARNTNPLVATAGRVTIVEAEEIVAPGMLDPESIITPGIYVDMIVESEGVDWKWAWE
ncbi:acyl CoA:acetate/3-ketoacid CoA transferase subunit alpha [Robertmurraya siralis]|uniref:Acyl CoA:acetate/3-ketoacid CoA transferase subunit alpha n=1 Tax=Robertmurraya siralis TaxID=77777 RepID=A0A919WJG3_9BACI|nr:CoA transferase subunit A [Robertmurraya siralis]GIN62837.1 acyl CoA:acetate/3-ketoacid CoA transferase subunit alpha [Robertmurraya siralis]